ncbi:MAG: hypothetical protein HY652_02980 [Acidobacteria bacterium]|nr:hypothetical protein [Acidobacteriota bacterium]
MKRWRRVLGGVCYLLAVSAAFAHRGPWSKHDRILIEAGAVEIFQTYQVADRGLSSDLRARFDRNADGWLGDLEQAALMRYVCSEASSGLTVALGARALSLEAVAVEVTGLELPLPSAYPLTARIRWRVALPSGAGEELEIFDVDRKSRLPVWYEILDRRKVGVPQARGIFRVPVRVTLDGR